MTRGYREHGADQVIIPLLSRVCSRDESTSMAATWATLLEPFSKGHQLPAQARTEPHVPQKEEEPMTITKLWQYLPFIAVQGELP